ncbi:hypothetical protein GCM10011415_21590 [Salipiger pallidus]|uniref:Excinuclease ABC subunit B n=1 Tax=Salipiger pallidus TaxID=1775170 RepID=A0A8J2ZK90_9RHOB|nr:excinuclease ABC subunit B [Salipiger pallidus]GGG73052.1 hypothetical protein GCM10011415_21590 [Salipiger pallidus]
MLLIPLAGLLALAACATPREACLSDAAGPWRSALKERERIAADLARGYTFETEFERTTRMRMCGTSAGGLIPCWETDTQPRTRKVPVDTAALRARDAQLALSLPGLRRTAEADVAQCHATYPKEPAEG